MSEENKIEAMVNYIMVLEARAVMEDVDLESVIG